MTSGDRPVSPTANSNRAVTTTSQTTSPLCQPGCGLISMLGWVRCPAHCLVCRPVCCLTLPAAVPAGTENTMQLTERDMHAVIDMACNGQTVTEQGTEPQLGTTTPRDKSLCNPRPFPATSRQQRFLLSCGTSSYLSSATAVLMCVGQCG
jgi:hypothetical protein